MQYLWIASFYAKATGGWRGQSQYYGRVLTAGSAIWIIPALLFAPGDGEFDWNFALLLSAAVNIHHFILDGVIWKLRHMKIARVLISSDNAIPAPAPAATHSGIRRKIIWALLSISILFPLQSVVERFWIFPHSYRSNDLGSAANSLERQGWTGRSRAHDHLALAKAFEAQGNSEQAIVQFELTASMEPGITPLQPLVRLYIRSEEVQGFVHACERLFQIHGIEAPASPATDVVEFGMITPEYRAACLRASRLAPPKRRPEADSANQGAGQDRSLQRLPLYN